MPAACSVATRLPPRRRSRPTNRATSGVNTVVLKATWWRVGTAVHSVVYSSVLLALEVPILGDMCILPFLGLLGI